MIEYIALHLAEQHIAELRRQAQEAALVRSCIEARRQQQPRHGPGWGGTRSSPGILRLLAGTRRRMASRFGHAPPLPAE